MEEYALSLHASTAAAGAIVPHHAGDGVLPDGYVEPIAEHNFARRKMLSLEEGIDKLRKDTRQLHETVTQQGADMKIMVSELDLRRAIGLAFQEFELRLEDAFTDSNRKCLAMFSKREEVTEMQALISKKVNWSEYNTVLKKLSDLRQYIDTMAESVFIGHRDALNSEFAKKADANTVEQALKAKADFSEVSEVRARLERLEVLVAHTDTRHSAALEELRSDLNEQFKSLGDKQQAFMVENRANFTSLKGDCTAIANRLSSAETDISSLKEGVRQMSEGEQSFRGQQERILSSIAAIQDKLEQFEEDAAGTRQDLRDLGVSAEEFRSNASRKFKDVVSQGEACRERLDFLMQATEMLKRKFKETNKGSEKKFGEVTDEQDRHSNQLAALERQLKRQERDLKAVENRANRAESGGGSMKALPAPFGGGLFELTNAEVSAEAAGNNRLKIVMEQLEKIAAGGHPLEHLGVEIDPTRPPLPFAADDKRGIDSDLTSLPRFVGTACPAPIDSARGPAYPYPAQPASARHGLSPRPAGGGAAGVATVGGLTAASGKTPRRKK